MKKLILIIISAFLILGLSACGSSSGNGAGGLKNEKIPNYSVKIIYDGKEIKNYSMDDIKKMPSTSLQMDGSTEQGPSIESILSTNNITDYSRVTVIGMYTDSITMTKEQVKQGSILDITNHNTVKLASKAIKKDKWVKDIATIKVEK